MKNRNVEMQCDIANLKIQFAEDRAILKDLENLNDHILNGPTDEEQNDLTKAISEIASGDRSKENARIFEEHRLSARRIAHTAMHEESLGADARDRFEVIYFTLSRWTDPVLDKE